MLTVIQMELIMKNQFLIGDAMKKFDEDVLKIIFLIKEKPAILVDKSVSCLRGFLDGFAVGYSFPNIESVFPDFQKYVEQRYNCNLTISWNEILVLQADSEEKAFYLFFEVFEQFLKESKKNY